MDKEKTQLTPQEITTFLQKQCAASATNLHQLVEGEESQAFSCECNAKEYVIRINKRIAGFQKDAYAYSHFQSAKVPIPKVTQLGYIDEHHAFCLTEKMLGITLQDVDSQMLKQLLQPTTDVWFALADCPINHTTGFGNFDVWGQGTYRMWSHFLLSILDPQINNWDDVFPSEQQEMFEEVVAAFTSLIPYCPEERSLIHGDFGANNVLTDGQHITAVLDWANAKYGDPLFDVATALFWSPWLDCMAAQAAYFEPYISGLPHSCERLVCYQLYIGLSEIYDSALRQKREMTLWALQRSIEIVRDFLTA